jgi:hypothetical protein
MKDVLQMAMQVLARNRFEIAWGCGSSVKYLLKALYGLFS